MALPRCLLTCLPQYCLERAECLGGSTVGHAKPGARVILCHWTDGETESLGDGITHLKLRSAAFSWLLCLLYLERPFRITKTLLLSAAASLETPGGLSCLTCTIGTVLPTCGRIVVGIQGNKALGTHSRAIAAARTQQRVSALSPLETKLPK